MSGKDKIHYPFKLSSYLCNRKPQKQSFSSLHTANTAKPVRARQPKATQT